MRKITIMKFKVKMVYEIMRSLDRATFPFHFLLKSKNNLISVFLKDGTRIDTEDIKYITFLPNVLKGRKDCERSLEKPEIIEDDY